MDEKTWAETDADDARNCMVYWKDSDGSLRSAGPLSRSRAESLVKAYQEMSPQRGYRVEPMPREVELARVGRIRRPRGLTAHKV